jgi:hypothetical protein
MDDARVAVETGPHGQTIRTFNVCAELRRRRRQRRNGHLLLARILARQGHGLHYESRDRSHPVC